MQRRNILFALVAAAAALYIAQSVGIALYEYREIEWIFTPSHFLGGMCVGLALLYMYKGLSMRLTLGACIAGVLLVGLCWEIYEYALGTDLGFVDTISDIIADMLGGYAAYMLVTPRS